MSVLSVPLSPLFLSVSLSSLSALVFTCSCQCVSVLSVPLSPLFLSVSLSSLSAPVFTCSLCLVFVSLCPLDLHFLYLYFTSFFTSFVYRFSSIPSARPWIYFFHLSICLIRPLYPLSVSRSITSAVSVPLSSMSVLPSFCVCLLCLSIYVVCLLHPFPCLSPLLLLSVHLSNSARHSSVPLSLSSIRPSVYHLSLTLSSLSPQPPQSVRPTFSPVSSLRPCGPIQLCPPPFLSLLSVPRCPSPSL